jgi:hypothetical protein
VRVALVKEKKDKNVGCDVQWLKDLSPQTSCFQNTSPPSAMSYWPVL